ncbi:hypothetical protein BGW38_004687 [Lunasporangiospora selenospora]|uniref:NDT80 domain-containing protein n=1 Tax=Lunasporangiospora selenospora TaxID=979761 RepID=A0A9P6KC01_9FUNG|nr:hypothetical protein BGW38_004687 [Lunasporangiospora selenospora]
MYNMTRTQQYKVRVMARIDRGFFTANKVWTCYRRNYFQVSTAFNILGFDHARESEAPCLIEIPDQGLVDQESDLQRVDANSMAGTLSGLQLNDNECNNKGPEPSSADNTTTKTRMAIVTHFSICIGSRIASSEKKIELIQHTPKRDKGPQIVPLPRPILGGGSLTLAGEVNTQSVATFERVQFKTATANNGKRRAAQQFYTLLVDLFAHLEDGRTVLVASSASDPLVVRGRSPGHYVDTPERDSILMGGGPLSPTIGNGPGGNGMVGTPLGERRLSSASQHSHSYFSPYPATHSRSHSLSAGAGMTVDMASLGLAIKGAVAAGPGPLSPLSPVGGDFHSPTAGTPHGFFSPYGHPGGNAAGPGGWVDASSLSSPSSVYDGSAFSSPTTTAAVAPGFSTFASPYGHTGSPQERGAGNSVVVGTSAGQGLGSGPHAHHQHHGQSYFPQQRQHSFGSITPRLMGGPGTGQPFETRLEPPLEQSYENEHESEVTDRSSVSLASTMATTTATTIAVSAATAAVVASSGYLPPIPFQTAVSTHQPMIKSEPRDEYFPYAGGAYAVPGSAMGGMGGMGVGATPLSADQVGLQTPPSSSTSTASSFGYPVQETRTHGGVIAGGYDGASYDPSGASHYGAMAGAGMPYIGGPQAQSILPSHGVVMEQRRAVWNGADA